MMEPFFTTMKSQAQYVVTRRPRQQTCAAYRHLNSFAMLLAQILFVDNNVKEGLPGRIEDLARATAVDGVSASMWARSAANGAALAPEDARFYSTLFLLQTAFDTLFVPDEDIMTYLNAVMPAVVVLSFTLHHCFHASVKRFFRNRTVKQLLHVLLVLEVSTAHAWTKPYYRWVDCERPENFHNIVEHGIWTSQTL